MGQPLDATPGLGFVLGSDNGDRSGALTPLGNVRRLLVTQRARVVGYQPAFMIEDLLEQRLPAPRRRIRCIGFRGSGARSCDAGRTQQFRRYHDFST